MPCLATGSTPFPTARNPRLYTSNAPSGLSPVSNDSPNDAKSRKAALSLAFFMMATLAVTVVVTGCIWEGNKPLYPSTEAPEFSLKEVSLTPGETDVPVDGHFIFWFTDRPDPATTTAQSFALRAGGQAVNHRLTLDYLDCTVTLTPSEPLSSGLTHTLALNEALTSLYGRPLENPESLSFTTGDATTLPPEEDPVEDAEVQAQVFQRHCGCCHHPETGDYRHILALEASSLAHTSSRALPDEKLVTPGSHAYSYLLHKVLGLPTIAGEPMPPPGQECLEPWPPHRGCPVSDPDLELLGRWLVQPRSP